MLSRGNASVSHPPLVRVYSRSTTYAIHRSQR